MKVLLIGSGAREHALAWKLRQSQDIKQLLIWPGSVAMKGLGSRLEMHLDADWIDVARLAKNQGVDFVVVGPEQPLADGFADACRELSLPCFGPVKEVAQLESSKAYAKDFMAKAKIPTAGYAVVQGEQACLAKALEFLQRSGGAVIKASGLASGKGVFVCQTPEQVHEAIERLYRSGMAKAAETVVIEEILKGRECSFFVFMGPGSAIPLGFAVDHKRLKDGDLGPNTGGMGCYTPVPWLPKDAASQVMDRVVYPLMAELKRRDLCYTGCLYVGLMWGDKGPEVVEFNVRLGDPEAEVLAVHDRRDWGAMIATSLGLKTPTQSYQQQGELNQGASVCVVLASPCYPYGEGDLRKYELPLEFLNADSEEALAFCASIREEQGRLVSGRGRILTFVAHGADFDKARLKAYAAIKKLEKNWQGVQYRQDIGANV